MLGRFCSPVRNVYTKVTASLGRDICQTSRLDPETLGRVLDPLGNPLDEGPPLSSASRLPLFRAAPELCERRNVEQTLWTGVLAIDAAIPIGRGQRELIIGDRNVGKTALALDIVVAQHPGDVACVYVVIGQPMSRVLALRETLERAGKLRQHGHYRGARFGESWNAIPGAVCRCVRRRVVP